jgi:hypothetical protein
MATFEQIREGELRPDQLEIGKVYRMEQYGRPIPGVPHRLIDQSLGRFNKIWGGGIFMEFTIVAPGTSDMWRGRKIDIKFNTSPMDNYYWRFFQTAQDRIVPQFEQRALQSVFENRLDKASAYGLTKNLLGPSEKKGGRKYKTRQTKMRRQNRSKKNHKRTRRMRH